MKIKKTKEKFLNFLKPLDNKKGMEWIQIIFLIIVIVTIIMGTSIAKFVGIPLKVFWGIYFVCTCIFSLLTLLVQG